MSSFNTSEINASGVSIIIVGFNILNCKHLSNVKNKLLMY